MSWKVGIILCAVCLVGLFLADLWLPRPEVPVVEQARQHGAVAERKAEEARRAGRKVETVAQRMDDRGVAIKARAQAVLVATESVIREDDLDLAPLRVAASELASLALTQEAEREALMASMREMAAGYEAALHELKEANRLLEEEARKPKLTLKSGGTIALLALLLGLLL